MAEMGKGMREEAAEKLVERVSGVHTWGRPGVGEEPL